MQDYEIQFYRPQGACAVHYFLQCASDRQAMEAARAMLAESLPAASVWQEERRVADLARPAPLPAEVRIAAMI